MNQGKKIARKKGVGGFGIAVVLLFLGMNAEALNLGFMAGTVSKPSRTFWGVSGQMGMIVPALKLEFEWMRFPQEERYSLHGGIMFRPKTGRFSPYGVVGVGTSYDKIGSMFKRDNNYLYFGFGSHLFLVSLLSVRADLRFIHYKEDHDFRISGGLFVHF